MEEVLNSSDLLQYICQYLPGISMLSLFKAYPQCYLKIPVKSSLFNILKAKIFKRLEPYIDTPMLEYLLSKRMTLTGSGLLYALTDCEFKCNDVDFLMNHVDTSVPYKNGKFFSKEIHINNPSIRLGDYGLDWAGLRDVKTYGTNRCKVQIIIVENVEQKFKTHDFEFVRLGLTNDKLTICNPFSILRKTTPYVLETTFLTSKLRWNAEKMKQRSFYGFVMNQRLANNPLFKNEVTTFFPSQLDGKNMVEWMIRRLTERTDKYRERGFNVDFVRLCPTVDQLLYMFTEYVGDVRGLLVYWYHQSLRLKN